MKKELPKRKQIRLSHYDYSSTGAIFITICAHNSENIFSRVYRKNETEPPVVELTDCGKIIEKNLFELPYRFKDISVERYVIMPNHIHILLYMKDSNESVEDIMCAFKSVCSVQCSKQLGLKKLWQRSYYDHVIRNDKDYEKIWNYIEYNSEKWLMTHKE